MRALAGVALLAVGLPATANAADYGGGTAPGSFRRADDQLTLISFRMADDGTGRATIAVATPCGAIRARPRIGLAADGTFAVDVGRGTGKRRTEITMSGQMVGPVASGTVRATVTVRRRRQVVDRCDSGVREWNVRAAGAVAAPAGAYYGLTSQTFPLVLGVAGSRVRVAAFRYRVDCGYEWENVTPGGRLAADGTFSLRERFSRTFREGRERFRVKVDGQVTATGATGTLSVTTVLRSRSGRVIDRCRTGPVAFAALL
jgi:opacity protein-like surface antigen